MPVWKRTRAAGESLDHHALGALLRQPVAAEGVTARFKALYDEKCDILIELRGHQLDGLAFVFGPCRRAAWREAAAAEPRWAV